MAEKIPEGSRVRVELDCEVYYDDGHGEEVSVRIGGAYGSRLSVPRTAIVTTRAPVQKPGALVWSTITEREYEVVSHDAESASYVVRDPQTRRIHVLGDTIAILPAAEARELRGEPEPGTAEAAEEGERRRLRFTMPPDPLGPDMSAEDVF